MKCSCGCGKEIQETPLIRWKRKNGQKNFYVKGHQYRSGIDNAAWKGGKILDGKGYYLVKAPSHPNARKSGYTLEHHIVMSQYIGRPIDTSFEIVHHVNGVKTDNKIENLLLITRQEHPSLHPVKSSLVPKRCPVCGKEFIKKDNHKRDTYCSRRCYLNREYSPYSGKAVFETVRSLRTAGFTHRQIAKISGVSKTTVGRMLKRHDLS